jgi:surfeit locus 1 family protein
MKKKFPWAASFICLMAFLVLCRLGFWQVERLQWKNNLQAELDSAFTSQPQELKFDDINRGEVRRGFMTGTPDMSKAIVLRGRVHDGRAIESLIIPFKTKDLIIPVEVGCGENIDIKNFIRIKSYEPLSVRGIIRVPQWSYFTPHNNIDKGDWWRLDASQLSQYWGVKSVVPVKMTQEDVYFADAALKPCPIEKQLRNDHLSYALFWFGMAFVLVVIWGIRFLKSYLHSA